MIEAIREIGEFANKGASKTEFDNFSKKIQFGQKKEKQYVLIFNFDIKNNRIPPKIEELKTDEMNIGTNDIQSIQLSEMFQPDNLDYDSR